jgi:hypothetical protein
VRSPSTERRRRYSPLSTELSARSHAPGLLDHFIGLPAAGSELEWVATVSLPGVEGQGIAWDRSGNQPTLWTIKRSTRQALTFTVPYRSITDPNTSYWQVLGPGQCQR